MKILTVLVCVISCVSTFWVNSKKSDLTPIVIVPGLGGSQIEAKTVNPDVPSKDCRINKNWFTLWAHISNIKPPNPFDYERNNDYGCWEEYIKLVQDENGVSRNQKGVHTRVPGWGHTSTVEFIDDSWILYLFAANTGAYMSELVKKMLGNGYQKGYNIRAATYDWRYAPTSQPEYFEKLGELVENTYEINGDKKVILLGHSMGGSYATYFLRSKSQEWKDKYIKSYLSLNVPYGGSILSVMLYARGYSWGLSLVEPEAVRDEQRTFETSAYLWPNKLGFSETEILLYTDKRNYTLKDYAVFFRDLKISDQTTKLFDRIKMIPQHELIHPGVDIICAYGHGLSTQGSFDFRNKNYPEDKPKITFVDGDQTVSTKSMRVCEEWAANKDFEFTLKKFERLGHNDIFYSEEFYKFLNEEVLELKETKVDDEYTW